jgi:hypothetical protein
LNAPITKAGNGPAKTTCRFCGAECGISNPSAIDAKATQVQAPKKINTRTTRTKRHYPALFGTRRHNCYGHAGPVVSKNTGEPGQVIWLVMMVHGVMDRLGTGRPAS